MKLERSDTAETFPDCSGESANNTTLLRETKYPRSFVCQYCSRGYTRKFYLKEHLNKRHGGNYKISVRNKKKPTSSSRRSTQQQQQRSIYPRAIIKLKVLEAEEAPARVFRKHDSSSYVEVASVSSASADQYYFEDNSSSASCRDELEEHVCNSLQEDDGGDVTTTELTFRQF